MEETEDDLTARPVISSGGVERPYLKGADQPPDLREGSTGFFTQAVVGAVVVVVSSKEAPPISWTEEVGVKASKRVGRESGGRIVGMGRARRGVRFIFISVSI